MEESSILKTNITLKMLIDSGIILPGTELFCANPAVKGILVQNGSIKVYINGKEKVFEYLSGAARHIEKRSINGWVYWQTMTQDGRVALSIFRDKYIALKKKA